MEKELHKSYKYYGDINQLIQGVDKTIKQMGLKIKLRTVDNGSFSYILSEKIKLYTTNWPVRFEINAIRSGDIIDVNITTRYGLWSITQKKYTQQRGQDFLQLLKNNAPMDIYKDSNRICTECDKGIPFDAIICPYCGEKFDE